jgi:putative aminopeptidase FrvX
MSLPKIDHDYLVDFLVKLLNIPSPTGFTEGAIAFVEKELSQFEQLELSRTRKGALVAKWVGRNDNTPVALTAHVDTLGAMVKDIKPNGRLQLTRIGGLVLNGVETEGCWVHTSKGEKIRGSYMLNMSAAHVYAAKVSETKREEDAMEVRLDARVSTRRRAAGNRSRDFVSFDPRAELTNGFIRSRHLDDKACVAAIVAAIKSLTEAGQSPARTVYFHISNYEEVGHGAAAGIPSEVHELVTVDMAAIGAGQSSDEYHTTICVKDSGGPYHHGLSNKLREVANANNIPYKVDIYPFYGSTVKRSGVRRRCGSSAHRTRRDASHNYERTHMDALTANTNWIMAYLF